MSFRCDVSIRKPEGTHELKDRRIEVYYIDEDQTCDWCGEKCKCFALKTIMLRRNVVAGCDILCEKCAKKEYEWFMTSMGDLG